jgi:hypothetical protein
MSLPVLAKSITEPFETLMAIFQSLSYRLKVTEICLQAYDEKRWLTACDYDGHVGRIKSQLDVAGRRK